MRKFTRKDVRRLYYETSEGDLPPKVEKLCDALDACFFSGDAFFSDEGFRRINFWLSRWSVIGLEYVEEIRDDAAKGDAD